MSWSTTTLDSHHYSTAPFGAKETNPDDDLILEEEFFASRFSASSRSVFTATNKSNSSIKRRPLEALASSLALAASPIKKNSSRNSSFGSASTSPRSNKSKSPNKKRERKIVEAPLLMEHSRSDEAQVVDDSYDDEDLYIQTILPDRTSSADTPSTQQSFSMEQPRVGADYIGPPSSTFEEDDIIIVNDNSFQMTNNSIVQGDEEAGGVEREAQNASPPNMLEVDPEPLQTSDSRKTMQGSVTSSMVHPQMDPMEQRQLKESALEPVAENDKQRKKRMLWIMVVSVILLIIIIVLAAVLGTRKSGDSAQSVGESSDSGTDSAPTPAPASSSFNPPPVDLVNLIQSVSPHTSFQDTEAPQSLALRWMLFDDTYSLENATISQDSRRLMQRFALATLYYSTGGPTEWDHGGWLDPSLSECLWGLEFGDVLCVENSTDVVEVVDLSLDGLTGTLPIEIGLLSDLRKLVLFYNSITGTLPTTLGLLTELTELDLARNSLGESGSGGPGSSVSATIPSELGLLTQLRTLGLSENKLSGSIPTELGNLETLKNLQLLSNELTGTVPTQILQLPNLKELWLSYNELEGSLQDENLCPLRDEMQIVLDCFEVTGCSCCADGATFDICAVAQPPPSGGGPGGGVRQ